MTIQTRDQFFNAMGNNFTRLQIDKASIANAAAGQYHSLWRATGQPGQGAIPAAAAVCDNTLTGAMAFTQQTSPATSYLAQAEFSCANAGSLMEIHDRLVHMGGLNGTLATAQSVSIDLNSLLATSNLDARKGDADWSDVSWWLEWYTDTGATAVTATVSALFGDASSANLTGISLAATRRASFMVPLNGLIQAAQSGKYIRGINNVTLSATTGTAGSFGVTATRYKGSVYCPVANIKFKEDWQSLALPSVPNSACLMMIQLANTTSTGIVRGGGKILHG